MVVVAGYEVACATCGQAKWACGLLFRINATKGSPALFKPIGEAVRTGTIAVGSGIHRFIREQVSWWRCRAGVDVRARSQAQSLPAHRTTLLETDKRAVTSDVFTGTVHFIF